MEISDIRIRPIRDGGDSLKAFCTITFDDNFVVRDLKIVEGAHGLFVAMPSRKLAESCPNCGHKNHLRARFCNECGKKLPHVDVPLDADGRPRLHSEIAHPINASFRDTIQRRVIEAFEQEQQGLDYDDDDEQEDEEPEERYGNAAEDDDQDFDDRPEAEDFEDEDDETNERDDDTSAAFQDEYSALIADLRRGGGAGGSGGRQRGSRGDGSGQRERGGRGRGSRGGGGGGGDRRGGGERRGGGRSGSTSTSSGTTGQGRGQR